MWAGSSPSILGGLVEVANPVVSFLLRQYSAADLGSVDNDAFVAPPPRLLRSHRTAAKTAQSPLLRGPAVGGGGGRSLTTSRQTSWEGGV